MVSKQPDPHPEIPDEIEGLRMTKQRKEIYHILMEYRDHPTASEVYMRAKECLPSISQATVYNCLQALVQHQIIRQVNFERESSRYCPNLREHVHFHDSATGAIHDVDFKPGFQLNELLQLPEGVQVEDIEITLRGKLPQSS